MRKYVVVYASLLFGYGIKGPTNIFKAISWAFYFSIRAGTLFSLFSEIEYKKQLEKSKWLEL